MKGLGGRIGRVCWFRHPETKEIIEGVCQPGRKIVQLTGMDIERGEGNTRTYNMHETTWTVPKGITIHLGRPTKEAVERVEKKASASK